MQTKGYRYNTNFQYVYFIAGACQTPDAAYFSLVMALEDRQRALRHNEIKVKELEVAKLKASQLDPNTPEGLQAQIDYEIALEEQGFGDMLMQEAKDEIEFLKLCIEKLKPHRKYAHLTDAEARDANDREEWAKHLLFEAQNHLMSNGTIPAEFIGTARQHPGFKTEILPRIEEIKQHMLSGASAPDLFEIMDKQRWSLPAVMTDVLTSIEGPKDGDI